MNKLLEPDFKNIKNPIEIWATNMNIPLIQININVKMFNLIHKKNSAN